MLTSLVRPSCLIIDKVGHCEFDKENTRLFFDLIDRRCNKEGAFNSVFTSNKSPSLWQENFNEDDSLLCALDLILDDATFLGFFEYVKDKTKSPETIVVSGLWRRRSDCHYEPTARTQPTTVYPLPDQRCPFVKSRRNGCYPIPGRSGEVKKTRRKKPCARQKAQWSLSRKQASGCSRKR